MTVLERQVTTEEFETFLQRPENQERLFELIHYVEVYQPDREMEVMLGNDLLDGGDILPGFTMSVTDVFDGI